MGQWRRASTGLQKFPRHALSVNVRITTIDPEIDPDTGESFFRSVEETTANLSRGGAFVQSWEPVASGRRVAVDIDLSSGEQLQMLARVAWTQRQIQATSDKDSVQQTGYGIEFTGGTSSDLACLERYLAQHSAPETPSSPSANAEPRTTPASAPRNDQGAPTP